MRAVPTRESIRATADRPTSGTRRGQAGRRRAAAALSTVPLFDGIGRRHLRRLVEESDIVEFAPGRSIVEEGQAGEAMFVILGGSARVLRGGKRVATLIPGDFFGELSALDGGPRTASVVAETPVRAVRLFRHTLWRMFEEEPELVLRLLEGLARRLRHVRRGIPVA